MTFSTPGWLYVAYIANILILAPVCYTMFMGNGAADIFENKISDSQGLTKLIASLWLSILIASIAGMIWPAFFAPLLLIQVFYKTVWLATFILPLFMADKPYPVGISICFVLIIISYPVLFLLATR